MEGSECLRSLMNGYGRWRVSNINEEVSICDYFQNKVMSVYDNDDSILRFDNSLIKIQVLFLYLAYKYLEIMYQKYQIKCIFKYCI